MPKLSLANLIGVLRFEVCCRCLPHTRIASIDGPFERTLRARGNLSFCWTGFTNSLTFSDNSSYVF
jgi:hypothetical protein